MKELFVANGIPTTHYVVSSSFDEKQLQGLHFPLVVKPVDAYSSKGVRKVNSMAELKQRFAEAQAISRDSSEVIVEEFFPGGEISVDAFVTDGKAQVLCVTNSMKILDDGRFIIFRGKYPAITSEKILRKIDKVVQQIADVFHITNAPMLVQLIANDDDISVIEFCARTGGHMKYLMIKHICGTDVVGAVIDLTLGKKPLVQVKEPENRYIVNDFIYCKEGVFDHLEGFEEMLQAGYITDYRQIRPSGYVVHGVASSSDRVAGITLQADSIEGFNRKHQITA